MHFYYLDESGDTGDVLDNPEQPVFVLGGISVRDEGWNQTQEAFQKIVEAYFDGDLPDGFELHAHHLLSPTGEGPFRGHDRERRKAFTLRLLDLLSERKHYVHFIAIDKPRAGTAECNASIPFNAKVPYLLAFDYMVTYINWIVRETLGKSARGLIIFDAKEQFSDVIELISRSRRFQGPAAHRIKWIVEFAYPVDSFKNPMVQLSDLVTFCVRSSWSLRGDTALAGRPQRSYSSRDVTTRLIVGCPGRTWFSGQSRSSWLWTFTWQPFAPGPLDAGESVTGCSYPAS